MKRKILILDDDEGLRELFRIIFERAGYAISIESNGNNILEGKFDNPDIFLLDKQLAGPDGMMVCRHLKQSAATNSIPVIMMSASPDIGILSEQAGADGFIEKPFNIDDLLDIIDSHIQKRATT